MKTNYDIVYFISDPGSSNTPGPSGNSRTHIQSVPGAQQPQQPLEPQATTSSASQQHQQLIFSNQQPQQPQQQPQQRASLNSNYDLSAELVQVLVNQQQQNNSENQNQLRSNSENQNQLRSNSENQNQLRSTQQQPQEQEEENSEDSWINAYRRHRQ